MVATPISYWIVFHVALVVLLAGEYLMARRVHDTHRKALYATALWVAASLVLAAVVLPRYGSQGSVQYLAAYAIEESLSIDNLFVFLLLFRIFRIPEQRQPKVLFWGAGGSYLSAWGAFIAAGAFAESLSLDQLCLRRAAADQFRATCRMPSHGSEKTPAWIEWLAAHSLP